MLIDDLPANMTAAESGDMIWVPYSGGVLDEMLKLVRRKGWDYTPEPHGFGTLLHCTQSPLGVHYVEK